MSMEFITRSCKVKICGIKSVAVAEQVGQLNPDLIGFVFAKSKRKVTPEEAGEMIAAVRLSGSKALAAGVFVNPTLEQLEHAAKTAKLDVIQLHGEESPDFCMAVKQRIQNTLLYKVFTVTDQHSEQAICDQLDLYRGIADAIMLDTAGGGTGTTFEWERIPTYMDWAKRIGMPVLVAGGLTADNVTDLIERYRPDVVDVSSGVETNGEKDLLKIAAFIERVNSIDQPSS